MTYDEFKNQLLALVKNYRPSAEALAQIKNVSLLIVIGPSGVGKTTLIDALDIPYVPSDTTRTPRPGEVNGVDMNFLSDYQKTISDIIAGQFVQTVVGVSGDFYGTRANSYPDSGWAVMPVLADVVPLFRRYGFKKTLSIFVAPPNFDEWMRRMGAHELSGEVLKKRLAEAQRSLEFALHDDQTHFIFNDNLARAVQQVKELLHGQVDEELEKSARQAAIECLKQLKTSL